MADSHTKEKCFTINLGDIIDIPPEAVPYFHRPSLRDTPPLDHEIAQPRIIRIHQVDTDSDTWRFPHNSIEKGHGLVVFAPPLPPEGGKIRVAIRDHASVCAVPLDRYEELTASECQQV
ncbi:MAG: hypothetical protein WCW66_06585 [Patescibacteria group bacterium]|jgi:hypothetical protein